MAIIKSEAVILKCDNYRETSKIITFFSKSHGKLKGIAKGVRSSKSRWGGALQSMAHVNVMFYYKENGGLFLISNAEYEKAHPTIQCDFDKMQAGYRMIELINRTTADHQENAVLFKLLTDSLDNLNNATKNYVNVLFNFEFRLIKILGFGMDLELLFGGDIDKSNRNQYFYDSRFSEGDIKTLNMICEGNFNSLMCLNISKSQEITLERFFESYFRNHFEHIGFSKAGRVFKSQPV
jgi:DNA repair protein RecO